jgi:hypothetical protein
VRVACQQRWTFLGQEPQQRSAVLQQQRCVLLQPAAERPLGQPRCQRALSPIQPGREPKRLGGRIAARGQRIGPRRPARERLADRIVSYCRRLR